MSEGRPENSAAHRKTMTSWLWLLQFGSSWLCQLIQIFPKSRLQNWFNMFVVSESQTHVLLLSLLFELFLSPISSQRPIIIMALSPPSSFLEEIKRTLRVSSDFLTFSFLLKCRSPNTKPNSRLIFCRFYGTERANCTDFIFTKTNLVSLSVFSRCLSFLFLFV